MDERLVIAVHECGHCVISLFLGLGAATLRLGSESGGEFVDREGWRPPTDYRESFRAAVLKSFHDMDRRKGKAEAWPILLVSFGGVCAQRQYCGSAAARFEYLDGHDRKQRRDIARAVAATAAEAQDLLDEAQGEAAWIVEQSWPRLVLLAGELVRHGRLSSEQIIEACARSDMLIGACVG